MSQTKRRITMIMEVWGECPEGFLMLEYLGQKSSINRANNGYY